MKNSAILKAGKTRPTIGTKIEGKKVAAIFIIYQLYRIHVYNYISKKTGKNH